jgi:hypothetical protein
MTLTKTGAKTKEAAAKEAAGTAETLAQAVTKPVTPHLAVVPPKDVYLSYISRQINGMLDMDVLEYHDSQNDNVLIEGPTGPGKTTFVMAYAAKTEKRFYAVPSNVGIEPSQLFGKYIPDGVGGFKWVDGPVTALVRAGGVLLINEVNFVPERVATVLFGLLDRRRSIILLDHEAEVIEAHPDLVIVADMNPEYEGTRQLNKAFRNRFAAQLFWDYDPNVEARLIRSEVLRNMAAKIRTQIAAGAFETPLSTNMLMEFEKIACGLSYDYAATNFVNHFTPDEREAVKTIVGTYKATLEPSIMPPETEEEAYARRQAMKDNEVDPEWGIKGVDWVWEDEAVDEYDEEDDGAAAAKASK